MRCRRRSWRDCWRSSACIRRWAAAGSQEWKGRSMLFKPEENAPVTTPRRSFARAVARRMVSLTITLIILGGLGYIGWYAFQPKQGANRGGLPRDLPIPVLA